MDAKEWEVFIREMKDFQEKEKRDSEISKQRNNERKEAEKILYEIMREKSAQPRKLEDYEKLIEERIDTAYGREFALNIMRQINEDKPFGMRTERGNKNNMDEQKLVQSLKEAFVPMFERIENRLDGIDGRLDGIDGRLDGIDERLDGIDGRLDGIDGRLDKIEIRLESVETDVRAIKLEMETNVSPGIGILREGHQGRVEKHNELVARVDEFEQQFIKFRLEEFEKNKELAIK